MLTQARLKELITYSPNTGKMFWRSTNKEIISVRPDGYLQVGIDYNRYYVHRLVFLYMTGDMPNGVVDHINQIKNDNSWENLRDTTQRVNVNNSKYLKGCSGVNYHKVKKGWQSTGYIGKSSIFLGRFKEQWDAICSRKSWEATYVK